MSTEDDGGMAFPRQVGMSASSSNYRNEHVIRSEGGMSLRDFFAAKAMAQLITGEGAQAICNQDHRYNEKNFGEVVAINAYEFADAMLKARQS